MDNQKITPEDGCVYVIQIPSGQELRDTHACFLRGDWLFSDNVGGGQEIPAQLANYAIRRKVEGVLVEPAIELRRTALSASFGIHRSTTREGSRMT